MRLDLKPECRANSISRLLLVSVCAASIIQAQSAHAQEAAEGGSDAGNDIIVTAQKRAERLQDVPLAITALTSEKLTQQNATSLRDFYAQVPGLAVQSVDAGQTGLSIRGVVTGVAGNPTVGVTIDDVPVGASTVAASGATRVPDLDPADLQRIEVLKGPQGTLYGASSMGGLVKYVTADASISKTAGMFGAGVSTVAHGDSGYSLRGMFSTPLVEDIFGIRASAYFRRDAGFVDNVRSGKKDVNANRSFGGRLAGLWKIAPDVTLKLSALYQHDHFLGSPQLEVNYLTKPRAGDLTQVAVPGTGDTKTSIQLYSAVLEARLNDLLSFSSITGYSVSRYRYIRDYSGFGGSAAFTRYGVRGATFDPTQTNTRKLSQEARLTTDDTRVLSGLVGLFYTQERSHNVLDLNARDANTGAFAGDLTLSQDDPKFDEYAVFGSALAKLSDRFDIQGGIRYSRNKQSDVTTLVSVFAPTTVTPARAEDSAVTYSVSPRFKINPQLTVYGRVATGYRAGGANVLLPPSLPASYKSDRTTNFELGAKGGLFDQLLSFALAVYEIKWSGIQVTSTAVVDNVTYSYIGNLGKARIRGAEFDFQLRPSETTHIFLNGAYNDSELTEDIIAPGAIYAPKGSPLVNVPKYSGSAGIDQEFPLGEDAALFVGATGSYVGKRYGTFARGLPNTGNVRVIFPGYTTLDLRAGYRAKGWNISAFVNNVTDSRGIIYSSFQQVPATAAARFYANVIRPRTFGVSFEKRFGQ